MAAAPAWLEVGRGREEAAAALDEAARGGARAFVLGASDLVSEERGQDAGKDLGGRQGVYTCMRTSCSRMKALRDGAREEEGWPAGPWVASVIKLEMHVKRISSFLPECTPAIALSAVRDILHAFGNVDDEAVLVTLVACPVDAKTSLGCGATDKR
ncbi:Hypothetical Protein FCC1311_046682 [Hondaea fermentalgiana]|uniref:Uncharacterized protein n=1 Tax=Hondaea fermentalgiana TaxID=2315210 RepID=A0A2R5GCY9_9STRA|nr:Hypothetical Protein FCC1311_046682 [Hondaea fermentalgiana]|eukprot:GBG28445.1 Hypothetical Protein FCC1311_046682 [Hondaea fermentalgiana]